MSAVNQKILLDVLKASQDDACVWFNLALSCDARMQQISPSSDTLLSVSLPSRLLVTAAAKGRQRPLPSHKSEQLSLSALELYQEAIARDRPLSLVTPKALLNCGQILQSSVGNHHPKVNVMLCLSEEIDLSMLPALSGGNSVNPARTAMPTSNGAAHTEVSLDAAGLSFLACFLLEKGSNEQCDTSLESSRNDNDATQANTALRMEAFAQLGAALQLDGRSVANVVKIGAASTPSLLNDERWSALHCFAFASLLCVRQMQRHAVVPAIGVEVSTTAVAAMLAAQPTAAQRAQGNPASPQEVQYLQDLVTLADHLLKLLTGGSHRKLDASHCVGAQSGRALELLLSVFEYLKGWNTLGVQRPVSTAAVTMATPAVTFGSLLAAIKTSAHINSQATGNSVTTRRQSVAQAGGAISTATDALDEVTLLSASICAVSQHGRELRDSECTYRLRLGEVLSCTELRQDDDEGVLDRLWKQILVFLPSLRPLPHKRSPQLKLLSLLSDVLAPVLRVVLLEPSRQSPAAGEQAIWSRALLMLALVCPSDDPFEIPTSAADSSPLSNSTSPTKPKKLQRRASSGVQSPSMVGSPSSETGGLLLSRRALLVEFLKREPCDPRALNAIARCLSDTSPDDNAVDVAHLTAPLPSHCLLGEGPKSTRPTVPSPYEGVALECDGSYVAHKVQLLLESLFLIHSLREDRRVDCLLRREVSATGRRNVSYFDEHEALMRLELEAMVELSIAMGNQQVLSLPSPNGSQIRMSKSQLLLASYLLFRVVLQGDAFSAQPARHWLQFSCGDMERISQRLHSTLYQWIASDVKLEQVEISMGDGTTVTIRREDLATKLVL